MFLVLVLFGYFLQQIEVLLVFVVVIYGFEGDLLIVLLFVVLLIWVCYFSVVVVLLVVFLVQVGLVLLFIVLVLVFGVNFGGVLLVLGVVGSWVVWCLLLGNLLVCLFGCLLVLFWLMVLVQLVNVFGGVVVVWFYSVFNLVLVLLVIGFIGFFVVLFVCLLLEEVQFDDLGMLCYFDEVGLEVVNIGLVNVICEVLWLVDMVSLMLCVISGLLQ